MDKDGQPTNKIIQSRRPASFLSPVPKSKRSKSKKKSKDTGVQTDLLDGQESGSDEEQQYQVTATINEIRRYVENWRNLPNPNNWGVTPETARLLHHWRNHEFQNIRPFFCQVEAVETAIWLTEVAPHHDEQSRQFIKDLKAANENANPELFRIALKLATGAGKTTVMAMLIAWQTINAVRHPNSKNFTRAFLVVAPGITVRDRLRLLQPNDPDAYYASRELIPTDMLPDLKRARIVITNYHAFKLREKMNLAAGNRKLLEGRGPEIKTTETEGEMLQRVMSELMGFKNIMVFNDEAHHCYREKPGTDEVEDLKGDEKKEAKKDNEAARLWISGLEMVKRKIGVKTVFDLSATPFFLRGSGYAEGTLFHWTASDFSLLDAIECGIVKLPRVPVSDNIPGEEVPIYRNLWEHIRKRMPKKGRSKSKIDYDPRNLPPQLITALEALFEHYLETYKLWEEAGIGVPPVFIIVCNNTSSSKLVYDFVSGFFQKAKDSNKEEFHEGRFDLFRNYDQDGQRKARPRTLLIDSEQLESGDALDKNFREIASGEIERFRREIVERSGDQMAGENITDQDLLREVMNTVGKKGQLGESIRCVVSVSMLTEGWDANTVTHVLGVRAFGTQLLCEQVVGRALRRQSYELNDEGLFDSEYADILGIPFNFTAKPVVAPPNKPAETVSVHAVSPERDHLEVRFPRVSGYHVELPKERLRAKFNEDSTYVLTPEDVGPTKTLVQGLFGPGVELTVDHLKDFREATVIYTLTKYLLMNKFRDPGEEPKLHLFGQLKTIVRQWLRDHLQCKGGTYAAQMLYRELADAACERIKSAIIEEFIDERPVIATLDPYNPEGSTRHVRFTTSKSNRYATSPERCHINWVIADSDWEVEFCRVAESHPQVRAYVKNHNLGFDVPYLFKGMLRRYVPDFIVHVDDGRDDPLQLIVEIKGYRGEDAKEKANTMRTYWVPGVNRLGRHGRWAFAEFKELYDIEKEFGEILDTICAATPSGGAK